MKLKVIGSGNAFGSGGRTNTCFFLETAKATLLIDCGASALPALKGQGVPLNDIDGVVLSHLHGDHFGGLPFFLLDARFLSKRDKPLLIAGPPGTRGRLTAAMEAFFPKSSTSKWSFDWRVEEIAVGVKADVLGHTLVTAEVIHQSGAPSTALRLSDGEKTFAYSGDTEWTDALLPIARDADLFICECYAYAGKLSGHMSWEILKDRLGDLGAKRTMITHMNPTMLAKTEDAKAAGVLVAADGLTLEF
ncbi:MAG: MBL fold metallo-hydrolase [Xanthobacteraceae bacterium]|uniref:MBL fold metallo-hydrolase n=1 Tax=Pseudolabrys sp. TaxID=1960880 RepID=UPI003D0F9E8A